MNRWHAHPAADDMVSWHPDDGPPFTLGEVIRAVPKGCLGMLVVLAFVVIALIMLGSSPPAHPGWWG